MTLKTVPRAFSYLFAAGWTWNVGKIIFSQLVALKIKAC